MQFNSLLKFLLLLPLGLIGLGMLVILPFIILTKVAVMFYFYDFPIWATLLACSVIVFLVLLAYLTAIDRAFFKRISFSLKYRSALSIVTVIAYLVWALFVIQDENVKDKKTAAEYTQVHPVLRLGIRTWALFDRSILITDMSRNIRDYRKMGLRTYRKSLHFTQPNGYVHAIDLRTTGRSKVHNWTTNVAMQMMGFKTLRHVGTADHLHVELALRKNGRSRGTTLLAKRQRKKNRGHRKSVRKKAKSKYVSKSAGKRPAKTVITSTSKKPNAPKFRKNPDGSYSAIKPPIAQPSKVSQTAAKVAPSTTPPIAPNKTPVSAKPPASKVTNKATSGNNVSQPPVTITPIP